MSEVGDGLATPQTDVVEVIPREAIRKGQRDGLVRVFYQDFEAKSEKIT